MGGNEAGNVERKEGEIKGSWRKHRMKSFIIFTLHNKLLWKSKKGDEICVTCRKQWRDEKCMQNFDWKV
jgi:hypothetical protein